MDLLFSPVRNKKYEKTSKHYYIIITYIILCYLSWIYSINMKTFTFLKNNLS